MARKLVTNVYVEDPENPLLTGQWYGPSYPDNEVTADVEKRITNPAAWEGPAIEEGSGDLRFRADDFGEDDAPNLREQAEQERLDREEAELESRAAIFGGTAQARLEEAQEAREARQPRKAAGSRKASASSEG